MEITSYKAKSRILPVLTFGHSKFNIWSYRSPMNATQFSWIPDLNTYQHNKFQPKMMSYEGDMIFQR